MMRVISKRAGLICIFNLILACSYGVRIQEIILILGSVFLSILFFVVSIIQLNKRSHIQLKDGNLSIHFNDKKMLTHNQAELKSFLSTRNLSKEPILTTSDETVFTYNRTNIQVKLSLYPDRIELYYKNNNNEFNKTPNFLLFMDDIAGSSISQEIKRNINEVFILIFAYPKEKYLSQIQSNRKRQVIVLKCKKYSNFVENLNLANEWHTQLNKILLNTDTFILNNNQIKLNDSNSVNNDFDSRPFLFYVNPKAGAGKAKNIYYKQILPVLTEANVASTLVLTTHANYVREEIKKLNLNDYRGIIAVSGDGLIYEIFNGLMEREDWEQAIKMPIGQIPGGSANALACCSSFLDNETFRKMSLNNFATQMTFNLIKSQPIPLDLMHIQLENKQVLPSFLSIEWAFIADLDLESEQYRYLGDMRFTVGALQRVLNLRIYRGRISFLPSDDMKDYKPKNQSIKIISNKKDSSTKSKAPYQSFKYLRPFEEQVPEDWLIIEDSFILFLIVNLPFISPDFQASPYATFNDGNMHLMFIKEGATKTQLLKILTTPGDKHHLDNPLVEFVKIKAFRLEPLGMISSRGSSYSYKGTLMVDGELVPYGKMQGEISPGLGRVFSRTN